MSLFDSRDEMPAGIEGVVDGCMDGEETLSLAGRLEALYHSLSSPARLMGGVSPVIFLASRLVATGSAKIAERGAI